MTDVIGPDCKLVWAMDENGEIGSKPRLGKNEFEISGESYERACRNVAARGRKRG